MTTPSSQSDTTGGRKSVNKKTSRGVQCERMLCCITKRYEIVLKSEKPASLNIHQLPDNVMIEKGEKGTSIKVQPR